MAKIENPLLWNLHSFHGKDLFTGRKSRGVYELEGIVDSTKVVEPQKCLNNLSSLSLLNTQQTNIGEDGNLPSDGAERPMTPIDETIQMAPKTFSMLCKLIRKRINPRLHWTHLSTEDQLSLGAVILGEVNAIWSVFRQQVDDPFLSRQQNKELQRRITVHVVTVCEQLFLYYCDQVKVLNSRGVFSEAANLSRIRGQLALDAGKYLNILAVRRHIVSDLRGNTDLNIKKKVAVTPVAPQSPRYLSFQRLIERSRPKQPPQHDLNIMQEIADMRRQMPVLDVGKVCSLLPSKPSSIEIIESYDVISHDQVYNDVTPSPKPLLSTRLVGNWSSEPLLHTVGILEDLKNGEDNETLFPPSRLQQTPKPGASTKQVAHHVRNASSAPHVKLQEPSEISKVTHSEKTLDPKQDLINLLNSQKKIESSLDSHEDIPPLIQAITRREAQEKKMKELKKCEKELRERKRRFDEEERRKLPDPKHPQPLMVQVEVPGHANPIDHNNTTIRALDMGIPDKVDLPSVSLQTHGPLYNDLTGEISPAAVKELDANLFQGEELKEVYHEIMQTMPNQHLLLHNDSLVITPVENIDINEVLASTTLMRPHSQQIINPDLKKKGALPPWVGESHSVWERKDQLQLTTGTPGSGKNFSSSSPMGDKTTRAYASWLACWKATINTDDYFKYLSTQETDFLGVIYHFYDSEAALSESDAVSKTMELEVERKRSEVFEEIKEKKSSYTEGFWNVQTVSMGGLGKYPDLEEYDVTSNVEGAIDEVSTSSRQLPTNLQSLPSTSDERTSSRDVSSTAKSQRTTTVTSATKPKRSRTLQSRFETVWKNLKMTSSQKLDIALKYSSDDFLSLLDESIPCWEKVTGLIVNREKVLFDLQTFERDASDPQRFFHKGHMGSSATRLHEAKCRARLYQKLENLEKQITPLLGSMYSLYDDVVTYEGRPYKEKMSADKVEMLYWLQEERRCKRLDEYGYPEQWKQFMRDNRVSVTTQHDPALTNQIPMPVKTVTINQLV